MNGRLVTIAFFLSLTTLSSSNAGASGYFERETTYLLIDKSTMDYS